jgi:hypothetical protein
MTQGFNGKLVGTHGADAIPLIRPSLTIGRGDWCDISLLALEKAGVHCELIFRNGYWLIRDWGSSVEITVNGMSVQENGQASGITVRGVPVQEMILRPNDVIGIGSFQYAMDYVALT